MVVRLVLWSVADSSSTYDELYAKLPPLEEPSTWLWNGATERFGALVVDEGVEADALAVAEALIGRPPDVYEEFDAV